MHLLARPSLVSRLAVWFRPRARGSVLQAVVAELRRRAECTRCHGPGDLPCHVIDLELHPREWCTRCLMGAAAEALSEHSNA